MELRQLEYFLEVCRCRTFTKAAEKLCVAQPSVTKAVQQIEQELGVVLFDRTQKPIQLTPEGELYRERVTLILRDLETAAADVKNLSRTAQIRRQVINLGVPPRTGIKLREMLEQSERAREQDLLFNLVVRSNPEVCSMLLEEQVSIGWIMNVARPYGLKFLPLERQEALCLLPPESPLAKLDVLTFEDLQDEPFAMDVDPRISSLGYLVSERCRQAGYHPRIGLDLHQFPDQSITRFLLRGRYGVMFTPQYDAPLVDGAVIRRMDPPLTYDVGLAWKDKRSQTPAERKAIEFISSAYPAFIGDQNSQKE